MAEEQACPGSFRNVNVSLAASLWEHWHGRIQSFWGQIYSINLAVPPNDSSYLPVRSFLCGGNKRIVMFSAGDRAAMHYSSAHANTALFLFLLPSLSLFQLLIRLRNKTCWIEMISNASFCIAVKRYKLQPLCQSSRQLTNPQSFKSLKAQISFPYGQTARYLTG